MATSDSVTISDHVRKNICAVLLSKPTGVPISQFEKDYQKYTNSPIKYKQYGFPSVFVMLKSLPDIVRFEYNEKQGQQCLFGIPDSETYTGYLPISFRNKQAQKAMPKAHSGKPLNACPDGQIKLVMSLKGEYSLVYPRTDMNEITKEEILERFKEFNPKSCNIIAKYIFLRFKVKSDALACMTRHQKELRMKPANEHKINSKSSSESFLPCNGDATKESSKPSFAQKGRDKMKQSKTDSTTSPLMKSAKQGKTVSSSAPATAAKPVPDKNPAAKDTAAVNGHKNLPLHDMKSEREKYLASLQAGEFPMQPGKGYPKTEPLSPGSPTKSRGKSWKTRKKPLLGYSICEVFLGNINLSMSRTYAARYFSDETTSIIRVHQKLNRMYAFITFNSVDEAKKYVNKWNGIVVSDRRLFCAINKVNGIKVERQDRASTPIIPSLLMDVHNNTDETNDASTKDSEQAEVSAELSSKQLDLLENDALHISTLTNEADSPTGKITHPKSPLPVTGDLWCDMTSGPSDDDMPSLESCDQELDKDEGLCLDSVSTTSGDGTMASSVFVFNFPHGTTKANLFTLFSKYKPTSIQMMNNVDPTKSTQALVLLGSRDLAKTAVECLDQLTFHDKCLIVALASVDLPTKSIDTTFGPEMFDVYADIVRTHWPRCGAMQEPSASLSCGTSPGTMVVVVTSVIDSRYFWGICSDEDKINQLLELGQTLNTDYTVGRPASTSGLCGAVFQEDVYRAWTYDTTENETSVLYLDWGNHDVISTDKTRQISDVQIWFMPPFCRPFKLIGENIEPLKDNETYEFTVMSFCEKNLMTSVRLV